MCVFLRNPQETSLDAVVLDILEAVARGCGHVLDADVLSADASPQITHMKDMSDTLLNKHRLSSVVYVI